MKSFHQINRMLGLVAMVAAVSALSKPVRVAIDLSFGSDMNRRERTSLARQLQRSIGANRRCTSPLDLHFTSFAMARTEHSGECLPRDEAQIRAWQRVDSLTLTDEPPAVKWRPEDLVFLSPDAAEPLTSLDPERVYVIGGIVDRQVDPGLSLGSAARAGAVARRLPLREHAERADAHPILNVDACVQILADVHGGVPWPDAIARAMPRRHIRVRELEEERRRTELRAHQAHQPADDHGRIHSREC